MLRVWRHIWPLTTKGPYTLTSTHSYPANVPGGKITLPCQPAVDWMLLGLEEQCSPLFLGSIHFLQTLAWSGLNGQLCIRKTQKLSRPTSAVIAQLNPRTRAPRLIRCSCLSHFLSLHLLMPSLQSLLLQLCQKMQTSRM